MLIGGQTNRFLAQQEDKRRKEMEGRTFHWPTAAFTLLRQQLHTSIQLRWTSAVYLMEQSLTRFRALNFSQGIFEMRTNKTSMIITFYAKNRNTNSCVRCGRSRFLLQDWLPSPLQQSEDDTQEVHCRLEKLHCLRFYSQNNCCSPPAHS